MPDIVDPRIESEEAARKDQKHKHLGMYIVEMRQVLQASQDNIGMLVRQMKGKVNQS